MKFSGRALSSILVLAVMPFGPMCLSALAADPTPPPVVQPEAPKPEVPEPSPVVEPVTEPTAQPDAPASEAPPEPAVAPVQPSADAPVSPAPAATSATQASDQAAREAEDRKNDPCKYSVRPTIKDAWIDRLQNKVFRGVCGGAVWFDSFFGDEHVYDTNDLYGRLGIGAIYKTSGEYDSRGRFDANIPLPNMKVKAAAFVGRDNEDDYITKTNEDLAVPATFLRLSDESSWLAGLGYTPSRRALNRTNFRLGMTVSTNPYVFGQARYQYDHYLNQTSALRFQENIFYRSSADGLGSTTKIGYDYLPSMNYMVRWSATGSFTQDTDGVKWNSFVTLYQDLTRPGGIVRGASYQLLVGGETKRAVPIKEYGFLGVYRQQVYRPWLFADTTLGYTFPRNDISERRKGAVNIGLVMEILFGNVPIAFGGTRAAKPEPAPR